MNVAESLKEMLEGGSENKSSVTLTPKRDFRKLQATMFCVKEENEILEECMHYSPSPTGDCTWRDSSFLHPVCYKENF